MCIFSSSSSHPNKVTSYLVQNEFVEYEIICGLVGWLMFFSLPETSNIFLHSSVTKHSFTSLNWFLLECTSVV